MERVGEDGRRTLNRRRMKREMEEGSREGGQRLNRCLYYGIRSLDIREEQASGLF